ncbi:UNKNOWN [Stylonychia lemnae]|uniref:Uncharacterized protein n=1 Tax=Stylonychia lemnae TaxID=5949 RepID=A0A078AR63_STYLE|nr:UNKNOWN [Stylonychia lemnae]|eukprot:CDW84900.1 UNKNOWN [Stylonychia lemnae]
MGAQASTSNNIPLKSKSLSQKLFLDIADDIGSGNADEQDMQVRIGSYKDLKSKFLSASKLHLDEQLGYNSTQEFTDESLDEVRFREQMLEDTKMLGSPAAGSPTKQSFKSKFE